jgi:hypothetical protein
MKMSLKTEDMTTSPMLDAEINLPEKINITKVVTYEVESIIETMKEQGLEDIDLDDVLAWIEDEVTTEFNSRLKDLIIQDENGDDI